MSIWPRHIEIIGELAALDEKSVRALRAVAAGTASDADHARLTEIEQQAAALRAEFAQETTSK